MDEPGVMKNIQFIAGYTEGGAPFGITGEEAKLMEEREKLKALTKNEGIRNCENPVDLVQLIDAFDMQSDHLSLKQNISSVF